MWLKVTGRLLKRPINHAIQKRLFLSEAYKLNDYWSKRFENEPILAKAKPENVFGELERQYNRSKSVYAIDVDLFVNSIPDDDHSFVNELLDVLHKLRMCEETKIMLPSTPYTAIRYLIICKQFDLLLDVLHDRLNYGIFPDAYLGNMIMDTLWEAKDHMNGARAASLFMLQEDFLHASIRDFALLHCYNYLKNRDNCKAWPKPVVEPEPKEEIKVRVHFIRNPYFDDHFDLIEPNSIVGKTLMMAGAELVQDPSMQLSFQLLGSILYGKLEKFEKIFAVNDSNAKIFSEILPIIGESGDLRDKIERKFEKDSRSLESLLEENVKSSLAAFEQLDLEKVRSEHERWSAIRAKELDKHYEQLLKIKRKKEIEDELNEMEKKEMKLWFFEKEEQIEMEIEKRQHEVDVKEQIRQEYKTEKQLQSEQNETYIPPFVKETHNIDALLKK